MITIALTKGRVLTETLPILAKAGLQPVDDILTSRKLIFPSNQPDIQFVVLRGVDVPTYVLLGAADMGIAGKDMLLEESSGGYYEQLDLQIAKCRMMTAAHENYVRSSTARIRVATKFVNIARQYYSSLGIQAEVIKLYGAMELAPILNLADEIVDIVDTGKTLAANNLQARDHIADISTRLIVNKASMKLNYEAIKAIINRVEKAVLL